MSSIFLFYSYNHIIPPAPSSTISWIWFMYSSPSSLYSFYFLKGVVSLDLFSEKGCFDLFLSVYELSTKSACQKSLYVRSIDSILHELKISYWTSDTVPRLSCCYSCSLFMIERDERKVSFSRGVKMSLNMMSFWRAVCPETGVFSSAMSGSWSEEPSLLMSGSSSWGTRLIFSSFR